MGFLKLLGLTSKKEKALVENGVKIEAVIKDVAINNAVTINGRNPRKLVCEGVLPDGSTRYFESGNVSPHIQPDVIGRPISVYVDPSDYGKYYIDVSQYK